MARETVKLDTIANEAIMQRARWIAEQVAAQKFLKSLPDEIRALQIYSGEIDTGFNDKSFGLSLRAPYVSDDKDVEAVRNAIIWVTETKIAFEDHLDCIWDPQMQASSSSRLSIRGHFKYGDYECSISLQGFPKPPLCKITPRVRTIETTTYDVECPDLTPRQISTTEVAVHD